MAPSSAAPLRQIHGTVVAVNGLGVLLRGPPGAGKSDLALRLIERGARLVADDRVELAVRRGRIIAAAPPALAGLIEARGLGVVAVPRRKVAELVLVVDLVRPDRVERMPDPDRCDIAGLSLPRLSLAPFEATAPIKVRLALAQTARPPSRSPRSLSSGRPLAGPGGRAKEGRRRRNRKRKP